MGCYGGYAYNHPSASGYSGSYGPSHTTGYASGAIMPRHYDDSHMMMSHRWAALDQYDPMSMAGSRRSPYHRPSMAYVQGSAAESPMEYAKQYKWWIAAALALLLVLVAAAYYYRMM